MHHSSRTAALLVLLLGCNARVSAESKAPPSPPPPPSAPTAAAAGAPQAQAPAAAVSVESLLDLLKDKKRLEKLTPDTVQSELAGVAPQLKDDGKNDIDWGFKQAAETGLVRKVTVSFAAPTWVFQQLSITIRPDDRTATLQQIRDKLTGSLKKPKWTEPKAGALESAGWALGGGWELSVGTKKADQILLSVGKPAGP